VSRGTGHFHSQFYPDSHVEQETSAGPVFAHGTTGAKRKFGAPPIHKNLQKKNCEALQYYDNNEFIELTVGTSRFLMSKAATNNICSNKHKA
jgi:hypothetical protein